ncbi:MAG: hypothetical protein JNM27_11595 [Leptospirales bacterium]|nr:hypothetical protein [Leptospirales bacterium]
MKRFLACNVICLLLAFTSWADPPGFRRASEKRRLTFPGDHRPHTGFKTEWWYYTGFLTDAEGQRYGFQFTVFKIEQRPNLSGSNSEPGTYFMVHFTLTDDANRTFYQTERIQRLFPGLAGMAGDGELYVANQKLKIADRHQIHASSSEGISLALDLRSELGPVLQGKNGFSPKGFDPGNASHYYSFIDLNGTGTLRVRDKTLSVKATAWMDHEFASNALASDQTGWDWFHFNLKDGRKFVVFRVRSETNRIYRYAREFTKAGFVRDIHKPEFKPGRTWQAPSGATYPLDWELVLADCRIVAKPWIDDQELRPAFSKIYYWEGAIEGEAVCDGKPVGIQGYMELTGYKDKMKGRF